LLLVAAQCLLRRGPDKPVDPTVVEPVLLQLLLDGPLPVGSAAY
jgi:hypothetical protein